MGDPVTDTTTSDARNSAQQFDAIVIGAGFGGLYALHKLREIGLQRARARDGRRRRGHVVLESLSRRAGRRRRHRVLLQLLEGDRAGVGLERGDAQSTRARAVPQLRRPIASTFAATSSSRRRSLPLTYDEARGDWLVETDTGESFVAQFVIAATGCLSAPLTPSIEGIDSFAGRELVHQSVSQRGLRLHAASGSR